MSEVDYQALYKQVVEENEALRLHLLKVRYHREIALGDLALRARDFIQENYLVLLFLLFMATSVISGIYTLYQDRRRP